jgi:hypothetical protein
MATVIEKNIELKFFLNKAEVNLIEMERALEFGTIEVIKENGKIVRFMKHESIMA